MQVALDIQSPLAANTALLPIAPLLAIAFLLSAWMLLHAKGGGLPGCGGGSACDAVTKSRWARWGPAPVAAVGAGLYLVMLLLAILTYVDPNKRWQVTQWAILATLALIAISAAAWFLGLSLLVLRKFCIYCGVIHFTALVAAVLLIACSPFPNWKPIQVVVAAVTMLTFIAGQLLWRPRLYSVTCEQTSGSVEPVTQSTPCTPVATEGASRTFTGRIIRLNAGRVSLNIDEWPVLGSPTARHVIGWLFDHTCEECHHQHRLLLDVLDRFHGNLAIVAIPVPMHASCNPAVKCKDAERIQACAFARLCWAIWSIDPARFSEWSAFMASEEDRQPFGLALKKAETLVDIGAFNVRGPDTILDEKVAAAVELYRVASTETVPAILLPRGILRGRASTGEELFAIIRKHLDAHPFTARS
jgi:uncharacterized membrane protein